MTVSILRTSGLEAYDLIFTEHISKLSAIDQETMHRSMRNSAYVWMGYDDEKIVCCWGLIAPTLLSDRAYLWLYTTEHLRDHVLLFVRYSQRAVEEMLREYPIIVGHTQIENRRARRWIEWLGATFLAPQGPVVPFEIRAEQWPEALAQLDSVPA